MRSPFVIAVFGLVLGVCLFWHADEALSQVVNGIRVEGNETLSRDRILLGFGVRLGEVLSVESVREGIRRLYGMGYFSDVEVYAEERQDGSLDLILHVAEWPRVSRIEISGNDKVTDSDIESTFRIHESGPFDSSRLDETRTEILKLYEEKGFPGADVDVTVEEDTGANSVAVEIRIDEGTRVAVKKIRFIGNEALTETDLRGVMETKEDRWWRTDAFLEKEILEDDLDRLVARYREEGYIDGKVVRYETAYEDDGKRVNVTIEVDEGPLYRVEAVEWQGVSDFARSDLGDLTTIEVGEIYRPKDADQTIRDAQVWYGERGYIHVRIFKREDVEPDKLVRVVMVVDEGEPAHVGQIRIAGNTRTKEKVIRRELTIMPGDLYQTSELIASQHRVANLGFFDGLYVDFAESAVANDIDLVLNLKERQTGTAGVGVSHTSEKGFTGFIDITEGNLFGNGQFLNFKWEFGKRSTEFVLGFKEPWFMDRHLSVGFDIYDIDDKRTYSLLSDDFYEDVFPDDYLKIIGCGGDTCSHRYVVERERRGGDVSLGWPFLGSRETMMYVKYTLEREKRSEFAEVISDVADSSGVVVDTKTEKYNAIDPAWKWRSGTTATLVRRTTDRRFHPRTGSYTKFSADHFGGVFGGDVKYQRYVVETRKYVPAFWRVTWMTRVRAGLVTGYGDPSTIPDDTRFELGGVGLNGIRGYDNRSILPRGNDVVGGRTMLLFSCEFKFPITEEKLPIYALAFLEGGNTWNSAEDTHPTDLYVGAGAGIRIEVPVLGSIGVDMGYGFDDETGGEWIAHYQFGFDYW